MVLALHYAEEIRTKLIESVRTQDRFRNIGKQPSHAERLPPGTKKPLKKALQIWVEDGLLTTPEAEKIERLVNYRNDVAHRVHELAADLSNHRFVRDMLKFNVGNRVAYDYEASSEMKAVLEMLSQRMSKSKWVHTLTLTRSMFETFERTLLSELRALEKRIEELIAVRRSEREAINKELVSMHNAFQEEFDPRHPYQRYDNGRLTVRGVEVCYRLFEAEYSVEAIAYAFQLSIKAVRRRKRMWLDAGGMARSRASIQKLPIRKFYPVYDD